MRIECGITTLIAFQHTAARRRLVSKLLRSVRLWSFQHTAARRRLALTNMYNAPFIVCFNTQPPEGGWI